MDLLVPWEFGLVFDVNMAFDEAIAEKRGKKVNQIWQTIPFLTNRVSIFYGIALCRDCDWMHFIEYNKESILLPFHFEWIELQIFHFSWHHYKYGFIKCNSSYSNFHLIKFWLHSIWNSKPNWIFSKCSQRYLQHFDSISSFGSGNDSIHC